MTFTVIGILFYWCSVKRNFSVRRAFCLLFVGTKSRRKITMKGLKYFKTKIVVFDFVDGYLSSLNSGRVITK